MFQIENDMTIHITRGDTVYFTISADNNGRAYVFKNGDVVRFKVCKKKDCSSVVLQKDFPVTKETERVHIFLEEEDTKIGSVISKPVDYWYEVELNPFTNPQTLVGYDDDGAKIFKLYPEGRDLVMKDPEDLPSVDSDLSLISEKPVQNRVVTKALVEVSDRIKEADNYASKINEEIKKTNIRVQNLFSSEEGNTDFEREVADARVGVDGKIYPCAGDAIREQVLFVVETAEGLHHDIEKILRSDTTIPENAFLDIQALETGMRISRDDIKSNGQTWEFADIHMVTKGNVVRIRNNTTKNWFENGRHALVWTDSNFIIKECLHVSDLETSNWEYEISEDGYIFVYFSAEELAYEIILMKNFIQNFDSRLSAAELKIKQIDVLERKESELENEVLKIKEDTNIFLIDKDKNYADNGEFGDKICEAFCAGKKIIIKDSNYSFGRDLVSYFPFSAIGLPAYNTNLTVSVWYLCGTEVKGIMAKTTKPFAFAE